jgi:hypothetical protein
MQVTQKRRQLDANGGQKVDHDRLEAMRFRTAARSYVVPGACPRVRRRLRRDELRQGVQHEANRATGQPGTTIAPSLGRYLTIFGPMVEPKKTFIAGAN